MRNKLVWIFALALALLLALSPAVAQYSSTEIAPGLYMLSGGGGNIGVVTGEDGIVLIDDGVQQLSDALLEELGKLSEEPVAFLINTHVHGDHVGANEALGKAGAKIVAHQNLRRRMIEDGIRTQAGQVPAPKEALPVLTFADSVTVHMNGREAFVFHVKAAHTDGDAVIHFRGDNIIHTGDVLFNGMFPYIDLDSGGTVEGYIAAQKRIHALADDQTKIIPGHGPVGTKKQVKASIDMLEDGYRKVRALVATGKSEEEIVKENPLAEYHDEWNWNFISTERMTKTFIRALKEGKGGR